MRNNRILKSLFISIFLPAVSTIPVNARALEALYLGGQLGHVALSGDPAPRYGNALGFGGDLGFRTGSSFDMVMSLFTSSHGGGLSILAPTLSADMHVGRAYDFDFTLGLGPGFYSFSSSGVSDTKFGLNFGGAVDMVVDDHIRVGLGSRYHLPLGASGLSGNFWTVTMRVGYLFTME